METSDTEDTLKDENITKSTTKKRKSSSSTSKNSKPSKRKRSKKESMADIMASIQSTNEDDKITPVPSTEPNSSNATETPVQAVEKSGDEIAELDPPETSPIGDEKKVPESHEDCVITSINESHTHIQDKGKAIIIADESIASSAIAERKGATKVKMNKGRTICLIDKMMMKADYPKIFCCIDHDTGDAFGACTFVVAKCEKDARDFLDNQLSRHKFKTYAQHPYTLLRLPAYRECSYFISATQRERLEEQIQREDSLLLSNIKTKDIDSLQAYYSHYESCPIRGGFIAIAYSQERALKNMMFCAMQNSSNDQLGLYLCPSIGYSISIEELKMCPGEVIFSNLQKYGNGKRSTRS